ncbi:galactose mutarotase [Alicyclobacillus contaminans]|uniref:aldose 1-epimerase n=1 Tax=Alicyclobacillus contaminans TaxID=392016 RepID=UPI000422CED0|nr:aldose 1-epimerase [Alicyclobacillus contaminans]GMA49852.1 galactose mutarotase [Alicyclobacillus contaminans]
MASIQETHYQGERAVRFGFGPYEAVVLPQIGANLISLKDPARGLSILREPHPEAMDAFRANPTTHGIPVLFPPNRIRDGKCTISGVSYTFPVNETSTHNHLHGFLHSAAWNVDAAGLTVHDAFVTLSIHVDEHHDVFRWFPHRFRMTLEYRLSDDGLRQQVTVHNLDTRPMPLMLGFHTAFNIPFAEHSSADHVTFTATIGERWEMDGRMLPTGRRLPLNAQEEAIRHGGISPFFAPLDNHYTANPQGGHNRVTMTDSQVGLRLIYDVGLKYRHWMIWNHGADGTVLCPEPQTIAVNAPNLNLPDVETGLQMLEPGQQWSENSRLFVETLPL